MMTLVYALVDRHTDWDEVLPYAVSAYNSKVNDVTGCTPNFLWYGRELRFTIGSIVPDPEIGKKNELQRICEKDASEMNSSI